MFFTPTCRYGDSNATHVHITNFKCKSMACRAIFGLNYIKQKQTLISQSFFSAIRWIKLSTQCSY